jgi:hypothetical protein
LVDFLSKNFPKYSIKKMCEGLTAYYAEHPPKTTH